MKQNRQKLSTKNTARNLNLISSIAIFILLAVSVYEFILVKSLKLQSQSFQVSPTEQYVCMPSLDNDMGKINDKALTDLNLKWLDNFKYFKRGILKEAETKTVFSGILKNISYVSGRIEVDNVNKIYYPYKIKILIQSQESGISNVVYFSEARVEKAVISKNGQGVYTWNDLKVNDKLEIEETVNLMIPNVDTNNNFTDAFVKSLKINII